MVSPLAADAQTPGGGRHRALGGYTALLVLAVFVFTVYRFVNTDDSMFVGTRTGTLLNALDGAVPGLLVALSFFVFRSLAEAVVGGRLPVPARRTLARLAVVVLPVYYVALLVVWFPRQSSLPGDWADLLEHMTFTQVFDEQRIFYTIGPAWAVSVAVLLTVLLIALAALADRCVRRLHLARRSRAIVVSVTIALLAVVALSWRAWSYGAQQRSPESFTTWYGPVAHLDVFAVGMALALVVVLRGDRSPLSPTTRWSLRAAGVGVLVTAAVAREQSDWVTVYFATASAVGFGLLYAAEVLGPGHDDRVTRLLRGRLLHRLAALSLSVYLWHEPVLLALRPSGLVRQAPDAFVRDLVVALIATLAVSWASYTAVQVPAVRLAALAGRTRRPSTLPPGRHSPAT